MDVKMEVVVLDDDDDEATATKIGKALHSGFLKLCGDSELDQCMANAVLIELVASNSANNGHAECVISVLEQLIVALREEAKAEGHPAGCTCH